MVLVLSVVNDFGKGEVLARKSPPSFGRAGFWGLQLQAVRRWLDLEIIGIFGVWIWILLNTWVFVVDALQVHAKPHNAFLQFGDGEGTLTAGLLLFEVLNDGVNVAAVGFGGDDFRINGGFGLWVYE